MSIQGRHHLNHRVFFLIREDSGCSSILNNFSWVHRVGEDFIKLVNEVTVVDKTWLAIDAVAIDKLGSLLLGQVYAKCANASAEGGFTNGALA